MDVFVCNHVLTYDAVISVSVWQALASTRVVISPSVDGPNSAVSTNAQTGLSKNRKFTGSGSDQDIVISSARAYVSALNKLLSWGMRRDMQEMEERRVAAVKAATSIDDAVPNGTEQVNVVEV